MSILIKQIPDDLAEMTGLAKYDRSRMPGCFEIFQAKLRSDGSFVTGLTAEEEQELSQELQRDVTKRSNFWETFNVVIMSDKEKEFNTVINPMDKLSYKMLVGNGYVAPNKESISDLKYMDAGYYAYTQETKDNEEVNDILKKDEAISKLFEISKNKERMVLYGQYLEGLIYHNRLGEATLFKMLRTFINKNVKNAGNFLKLYETPIDEVVQKVLIDKALKQKLIKIATINKNQVYQYGNITLGNSLKDLYTNLGKPEFAPELVSIKEELEK